MRLNWKIPTNFVYLVYDTQGLLFWRVQHLWQLVGSDQHSVTTLAAGPAQHFCKSNAGVTSQKAQK